MSYYLYLTVLVTTKIAPYMAVLHVVAFLFITALCVQISYGRDSTVTYKVPAGSRECFFEDISENGEVDLEYQVFRCFMCLDHCSYSDVR